MSCIAVVWIWGSRTRLDFWNRRQFQAEHWFILGVSIHFTGSFLDNSYWAAAWQQSYLGSKEADQLFQVGVISNIFSRQTATFMAALCHLQAAATMSRQLGERPRFVQTVLFVSLILGIGYVALLMILKSSGT